jgi:DNA-binding response OmpR family regulator
MTFANMSPPNGAPVGTAMTEPVAPSRTALVIDDSPEIVAMLVPLLQREGFVVEVATDGERAVELARAMEPDLIILDLALPKLDGTEVCRRIRSFTDAYLIMLTARADEVDMLVGLAVGADDYLKKPFSPRELTARIRTLLRRPRQSPGAANERLFGNLSLDVGAREVRVDGSVVELTKTEFDLLAALSSQPRVSFTRPMLIERVWGANWYGDAHLVDVHIANLRRKLGDDPRTPSYVRTVRGVGYRMGDG